MPGNLGAWNNGRAFGVPPVTISEQLHAAVDTPASTNVNFDA
jgi:hypothetical protein